MPPSLKEFAASTTKEVKYSGKKRGAASLSEGGHEEDAEMWDKDKKILTLVQDVPKSENLLVALLGTLPLSQMKKVLANAGAPKGRIERLFPDPRPDSFQDNIAPDADVIGQISSFLTIADVGALARTSNTVWDIIHTSSLSANAVWTPQLELLKKGHAATDGMPEHEEGESYYKYYKRFGEWKVAFEFHKQAKNVKANWHPKSCPCGRLRHGQGRCQKRGCKASFTCCFCQKAGVACTCPGSDPGGTHESGISINAGAIMRGKFFEKFQHLHCAIGLFREYHGTNTRYKRFFDDHYIHKQKAEAWFVEYRLFRAKGKYYD